MAENAREVMEILNISCYRHGKVKSKLTKTKELLNDCLKQLDKTNHRESEVIEKIELFLKENE